MYGYKLISRQTKAMVPRFCNLILLLCLLELVSANLHKIAEIDDNEFAEFEFGDEEDDVIREEKVIDKKGPEEPDEGSAGQHGAWSDQQAFDADDVDITVEDEDDFDHFEDSEEFEGYDPERSHKQKSNEPPQLKITDVPLHLRANWDSFYMEILMICGLITYAINFIFGKTKNQKLATAWFQSHRDILDNNFSIVGDDGTGKDIQTGVLMKESEHVYALWCTGRSGCEGMLVELKLLKRQDIINTITRMMRPACDQITVTVEFTGEETDPLVFAIGNKRSVNKLSKDMIDLGLYCGERKSAEKFGLNDSHYVSESGELTNVLLDSKIVKVLQAYESCIDYVHFSDQYCGAKNPDKDSTPTLPQVKKVIIFVFNVPGKGKTTTAAMEEMEPLMKFVIYCIDKVKRMRISKEAKGKSDRIRAKVADSYLKQTHSQRQEAAQQRREDKIKAEKERMMNEEDPDKQRKLEEQQQRREAKKRQPKIKQMKIQMKY